MEKHFEKYTLKDFLTDEQFLQWKFLPSEASDNFWLGYIKGHPEQEDVINEALRILNTVRFNVPDIADEEIKHLYDDILLCYDRYRNKDMARRRLYTFTRYAASIIILCLTAYGTYIFSKRYGESSTENTKIQIASITADSGSIKLYVGNKEFVYDEDADITFNEKNGKIQISNNNETEYEEKLDKEIRTNKIVVPYGKRSTLHLSDGTQIYLNSGTTMIFPSKFTDERSVSVEGEIYIKVKKDEQKPFIVRTNTFDVRVLGTTFNISAYPADSQKSVVLVEGSVAVTAKSSGIQTLLRPSEMYNTNGTDYTVSIVNTYAHTSWKDGILFFTNEPLANITRKLSRYYSVNIVCDDALAEEECTGKLVLFNNLEDILNTLSDILPLTFNIADNTINIMHE